MMIDVIVELEAMLKYPALYRHKIHAWVKNGLLLKYSDELIDEDLKEQVKALYRKEVEKLSTTDLMFMYSKMLGSRKISATAVSTSIQKNWIRTSPSKRGKRNVTQ